MMQDSARESAHDILIHEGDVNIERAGEAREGLQGRDRQRESERQKERQWGGAKNGNEDGACHGWQEKKYVGGEENERASACKSERGRERQRERSESER